VIRTYIFSRSQAGAWEREKNLVVLKYSATFQKAVVVLPPLVNLSLLTQGRRRNSPMLKLFNLFCLVICLITSSVTFAFDYNYKKIADFKTLGSFKSVNEFESYYYEYIQDCLDHTGGGIGGKPCLIGYEIWDRELNIYYDRLVKILGEKEKELLKEAQLAWIKERDNSIAFNSRLLDNKYENKIGTMYALIRAEDADNMITPIVKQRAFLLKKWLEFIEEQNQNK
jgi:uncharacterized protein YecT (DUF1311 family)